MTCYDVRFPEVARSLAVRGADVITSVRHGCAGV